MYHATCSTLVDEDVWEEMLVSFQFSMNTLGSSKLFGRMYSVRDEGNEN